MKTRVRFRSLRERWHRLAGSRAVRLGKISLVADPELVGPDVQRLLYRHDYEFAELQMLRHVLRPGDRVLEIGAGTGAVGLTAAAEIGADRVTSLEANPALEKVIRANYELNGMAPTLVMKAATVDGAPVVFNVMPSLLSSSIYDRGAAQPVEVESVAINDAIAQYRPTVLVVDVEGAEVDLLPAANLDGVRAVLVETHAKVTGQDPVDRMIADLVEAGFTPAIKLHRNFLMLRP
jgi:FkbM family methyltransferase